MHLRRYRDYDRACEDRQQVPESDTDLATPTDQEFERAQDQLLGLVQMWVPGIAIT